jgi:hypothetical protein
MVTWNGSARADRFGQLQGLDVGQVLGSWVPIMYLSAQIRNR